MEYRDFLALAADAGDSGWVEVVFIPTVCGDIGEPRFSRFPGCVSLSSTDWLTDWRDEIDGSYSVGCAIEELELVAAEMLRDEKKLFNPDPNPLPPLVLPVLVEMARV